MRLVFDQGEIRAAITAKVSKLNDEVRPRPGHLPVREDVLGENKRAIKRLELISDHLPLEVEIDSNDTAQLKELGLL